MSAPRRLLTATCVDQHGHAAIEVRHAETAIAELDRAEALIERLLADLARALGLTEGATRARYNL